MIDLSIPESWEALSQDQLRWTMHLMSCDIDTDRCRAILFGEFTGICIIGHSTDGDNKEGGYLVKVRGYAGIHFVSYREIVLAYATLDWLGTPPRVPVRPDKIAGAAALHPRLAGVTFETFLACESYFQGYVATGDESLIRGMVSLLYPGIREKDIDGYAVTASFFWFSGLKTWLLARYDNFFRPAGAGSMDDDGMPDMGAIIRTQIRALTKGDITKNAAVLSSELHDALHELDALAAEYEKIKSESRKNKA